MWTLRKGDNLSVLKGVLPKRKHLPRIPNRGGLLCVTQSCKKANGGESLSQGTQSSPVEETPRELGTFFPRKRKKKKKSFECPTYPELSMPHSRSATCQVYLPNWNIPALSWRRKWQSTPIFVPVESHEWRSLAGYLQFMRSQRV